MSLRYGYKQIDENMDYTKYIGKPVYDRFGKIIGKVIKLEYIGSKIELTFEMNSNFTNWSRNEIYLKIPKIKEITLYERPFF